MDMSPTRPLMLGLIALLLASAPAVGGPGPQTRILDHEPEDCDEFVPAAWSDPVLPTTDGPDAELRVLVLLDGVERAAGEAIVSSATDSYGAIDIKLTPTYRKVVFPEDTVDAGELIEAGRSLLGGTRPDGTDVVYIATSKDVSQDQDTSVAGYADCIGGIRYPTRAFAVGEALWEVDNLGLQFFVDAAGRIMSHEIGHLLGAHHHYANCVEGDGFGTVESRDAGVCTVMINLLDVQGSRFGMLESMIVRGHVEDYTAP